MAKLSAVLCLFLASGQAHAGLEICNDTGDVQSVSIGYKGESEWTSEGWWVLQPGKCSTPVSGDLEKRYYYYRAEVSGGAFTGGNFFFCTSTAEYTIVGDDQCAEQGYDREDFSEIDTGKTGKHFVLRLTPDLMAQKQPKPKSQVQPKPPTQTQAGLTVCNKTEDTQAISIGYKLDEAEISEGWWNVEPGACKVVIKGKLKTRYYYYRAEVNGGGFDGQDAHFCTSPEIYTIEGRDDCSGRGYDREAFRMFDTGDTLYGFTLNLVP
ncbi:DUF1036 domain-containing protein [uncultured Shimia sp.]|uniref:DUF1036 domain-containing protein n=1 Tax=uncultured Shimia sp. TaxID=573152 RepID=UPI0026199789|nr:DUF1036 domain-containing protein [uncultured Shimia sp.]